MNVLTKPGAGPEPPNNSFQAYPCRAPYMCQPPSRPPPTPLSPSPPPARLPLPKPGRHRRRSCESLPTPGGSQQRRYPGRTWLYRLRRLGAVNFDEHKNVV